jgi:hypothetical protein
MKINKNFLENLIIKIASSKSYFRNRVKRLIDKKKIGSFEFRYAINSLERMHYAYIVLNAASLAKRLNIKTISVIEYGVAGGRGLLLLEYYATEVKKLLGVDIEIYGFDMGSGLPEPEGYRDLPYHWKKGFFKMDVESLKNKLKISKLVLGNITDTANNFFSKYNPAPVGAIINDFDFYSSTNVALSMISKNPNKYLPRVFCYFDDVIGSEDELYNDFTGERLSINEFNQKNNDIKISKAYNLLVPGNEIWHHQIWHCHIFKHRDYNQFTSKEDQQLK